MHVNLTISTGRRVPLFLRFFFVLVMGTLNSVVYAALRPDQAMPVTPAGDGWQVLTAAPVQGAAPAAAASMPPANAPAARSSVPDAIAPSTATGPTPLAVAQVTLPGAPSMPSGTLTLTITPQDINLRNALDRWLQTQGWQLAWKIDDDLPLEFNATFTGDFTSVLTQVMKATSHMRTPTRICRHTNNVIRVIARAANCQD